MISREELRRMQKQDIRELDRVRLANAEDLVIDKEKSTRERIRSFIEQTKNPFAQNVGPYILQIGYREDTEETLEDRMALLIQRMARLTLEECDHDENRRDADADGKILSRGRVSSPEP